MQTLKLGYRACLDTLNPYIPGKRIEDVRQELGLTHITKMASNENPLGCSPKVKEAIEVFMTHPSRYPDSNCTDLRKELAERTGLAPGQFVFGAGSFELIDFVAETFINPGDEAISSTPSFAWYKSVTKLKDGKVVSVPLKDFYTDLQAIRDNVTDKTKVIWLCNPNNPTGTIFTHKELIDFLNEIPPHIIVVLDEAYSEFVTSDQYPDSPRLIARYPNLLVLRTFSKIYGLAALRIGYCIASEETAGYMNRVRQIYNVNAVAQISALASLKDDEFRAKAYRNNREGKHDLYAVFEKLKLPYVRTEASFILVNVGQDSEKVCRRVLENGIIIRPGTGYGLAQWIRVSIGTSADNERFSAVLEKIL